jgi:hypothetical protein
VDGQPELTRAWPPTALMLKGASQGAEDGETRYRRMGGGEASGRWRAATMIECPRGGLQCG